MGLELRIITLNAIKSFAINLIPINRTLKHIFTRIDRVLMAVKVRISIGAELTVVLMAFTL